MIQYLGDTAISVRLSNEIAPDLINRVHGIDFALGELGIEGIVETIPTYNGITIFLDPVKAKLIEIEHGCESDKVVHQVVSEIGTVQPQSERSFSQIEVICWRVSADLAISQKLSANNTSESRQPSTSKPHPSSSHLAKNHWVGSSRVALKRFGPAGSP